MWQARWRDPGGRQRARNFERKVDAENYLVSVEADMLEGRYTDPSLARMRLSEWMAQHRATRVHLGAQTRKRDEGTIRNHVLPAFGSWPMGAIKPMHVAEWVTRLSDQGLAPATVHKAYQLLSLALDAAVESGHLRRSPCRGIRLPRLTSSDIRFLDVDEIAELVAATEPRYRAMVQTAAYTGLRFSELRALRVDRLDLDKRTLRVTHSLVESGDSFTFSEPKSEASRRTVRVPRFLSVTLARHLAVHRDDSGLVFSAPEGGPIRRSNFRHRVWLPAADASVGPPCRFHDLRHSHAALLIAQGEHPKVIQERLGHASIKTTLDTYGHLFDGLDEAAVDRLDAAYERSQSRGVCTRCARNGVERLSSCGHQIEKNPLTRGFF